MAGLALVNSGFAFKRTRHLAAAKQATDVAAAATLIFACHKPLAARARSLKFTVQLSFTAN